MLISDCLHAGGADYGGSFKVRLCCNLMTA